MVSVKKKRQLDSWLNRARKIEEGVEKSFIVEGKDYTSAFACYEEAYKVDPDNVDVCLKLYNLWPAIDRPISHWRQIIERGPLATGEQFSILLRPAHTFMKQVLSHTLMQPSNVRRGFDVPRFTRELCCLDPSNQGARTANRMLLRQDSADDCMLYLMDCGYDEEVVGKALDADPGLARDWQFWEALSFLSLRGRTLSPRLKALLQGDARVSPSGVVVVPSMACKAICLQLENEGRVVDATRTVTGGRLYTDLGCCPYLQLVPTVRKLALAPHAYAMEARQSRTNRKRCHAIGLTYHLEGPGKPKREFFRGEYLHMGDVCDMGNSELHSALHRKEIGPRRESAIEVLASWTKEALSAPTWHGSYCVESCLRNYLSLRYCHGDCPMEPVRLEVLSDVDSKAVEESRKLALSGSRWHQAFFLWSCRSTDNDESVKAAIRRAMNHQVDEDVSASTKSSETSLALLERRSSHTLGSTAKTYSQLRKDVWLVALEEMGSEPWYWKSPSRNTRTSLARDELLAVSRVPFTPSWLALLLFGAQRVDVLGGPAAELGSLGGGCC